MIFSVSGKALLIRRLPPQFLKIMKLTAVLLTIAFLQVHAKGFPQITISLKNVPVEKVFFEIERQAGYGFLYTKAMLSGLPNVTIRAKNASVNEVLNECFKGQPMAYSIENNTIVVTRKAAADPASPADPEPLSPPVEIRGRVLSSGGEPLQNVSVTVVGSRVGTTTNNEGRFTLATPDNKNIVLEFSSVGYQTKRVNVGNKTEVNVVLELEVAGLSDVIVVGYGTQKKGDVTGAVSSVKGEDLSSFPASNLQLALSGRVSGVQVMQNNGSPGAPISIRIRGTNSIRGDNEPLYVIDGFPTENSRLINNSDIESIEVLKDASATAIYGSRGANGVVIITTKGGKSGKTLIDYESSFAIQKLRKKIEMMNAEEYAKFENRVAESWGLPTRFSEDEIKAAGKGFDWQDFVYQKALMQSHNLSVRGGNSNTKFVVSGSYLGQDGIIKNSGYYRYSLNSKLDHQINKKLNLSSNVILTYVEKKNQNSGGPGRGTNLIGTSFNAFPTLTPYLSDGTIRDLRNYYNWNPEVINPAYFIDETKDIGRSNNILARLALTYEPIEDLKIKITGGLISSDTRSSVFVSSKYYTGVSSASMSRPNTTSYLNEGFVTYDKTIGKHSLQLMSGYTFQDHKTTSLSASGAGFLSDVFDVYNLGAAKTPGIPSSSYEYSTLISALGRINYDFDKRFLVTINFRADGSSVYSDKNKWGYFPSGSVAWRISNEKFFNIDFISDLKVRGSWGVTGSQAINPYSTLRLLSSATTGFGNGVSNYFALSSTVPTALKWESTKQTNIGFDLSLFKSKLDLTANYYIKNTEDLLNPVPLSPSTGFTNTLANIGSIKNNGLELELAVKMISNSKLRWNIGGNVSFNRNRVTKLYKGIDIYGSNYNVTLFSGPINIIREGQPLGSFFGYKEDVLDENGIIQYIDINADNKINDRDRVILGNPNPRVIYGFSTNLSYKNFDLSIFFNGVEGREIFNIGKANSTLDARFQSNFLKDVYYNTWDPAKPDPHAKYPKPSANNLVRVSDRFVEDGSYLRLRNIQLSYNLPVENIGLKGIKNLQVYIGGENLLTFTQYSWWDPEVNSSGSGNSVNLGIDSYTYPTSKSFDFGIRATF